ncbi:MAG: cytochrome c [Alphaproteobacteria bacterium]|nr:cytochrome c [Alphaproteobacteria bacterium]
MRKMTQMIVAGTLMLSVSGLALAADVVKERQDGFKENVTQLKAIKAGGESGDHGAVQAAAESVAAFAAKIPDLFPEGTGGGETRAKDEIWSDWQGFVAAAEANEQAALKLASAAESGVASDIAAAQKALGESCGACHDKYRLPKK